MAYLIRLPLNKNLDRLVAPHLGRPVGLPPQSGIQVKIVDLHYQAKSWNRPRGVVAKIQGHRSELFPRIGFVITNSRIPAGKVRKVYNGRAEIEKPIKEAKNTLRVGQKQLPKVREVSGGEGKALCDLDTSPGHAINPRSGRIDPSS
jgi:hypothetical protein